jgi:replication fork protection complex subunit Tof1/Swi1
MVLSSDEEAVEAAEIMQHQIYYNGEVLDLTHLVVLKFKDQSLA